MPPCYCDYCNTTLTHDSPSVRKQHKAGYKHKAHVREYYQQFEGKQTQSLIDQRIKEHLGQAAAFLLGAPFNGQHLLQFPANVPGYHGAPTTNMRPQTRSGAPGTPVPNSGVPPVIYQTYPPPTPSAGPPSGAPPPAPAAAPQAPFYAQTCSSDIYRGKSI